MGTDVEKWYADWRQKDYQLITSLNLTREELINALVDYRFRHWIDKFFRKLGAEIRAKKFELRNSCLAFAISEIEKSGQSPTKKRLEKQLNNDQPHLMLTNYALTQAIRDHRKKRFASKSADGET